MAQTIPVPLEVPLDDTEGVAPGKPKPVGVEKAGDVVNIPVLGLKVYCCPTCVALNTTPKKNMLLFQNAGVENEPVAVQD